MAFNPPFNPDYQSRYPNSSNDEALTHSYKSLKEQGFTDGLIKLLLDDREKPGQRFWIIDNSGSMNKCDGHRLVPTRDRSHVKVCACTRWEELRETVSYHVDLAGLLQTPTQFELLNRNNQEEWVNNKVSFSITCPTNSYETENAHKMLANARPGGSTPLVRKVLAIEDYYLKTRQKGEKVALVIATDGLPTDDEGHASFLENQQFVAALKSLWKASTTSGSIWIVIRLCTDDPEVVSFYNSLDDELEFPLEVLDDFLSEAKEVYSVNSWINYALPLHRIRESGYRHYLLDLIDERPLTIGELKEFCSLLFGDLNLPNPETSWGDFVNYLRKIVQQESSQWSPMRRKLLPWIDISKLNHIYGRDRAGCSSGIWLWALVLSMVWVLVWVLRAIQPKMFNFT